MSLNQDKVENIINKHRKYWQASEEYKNAIDELNGMDGLSFESIQRLRIISTKLMAVRCQIEFELNRILDKIK